MVPTRILLLTPEEEAPELTIILRASRPQLDIVPVHDKSDLLATEILSGDRLLSLFSPVIVPPEILKALDGPAYNIHPGPPEFPGLFPAVHAIMAGATSFGATAHEMTADVDSGRIVALNKVDIAPDIDRLNLEYASRILALKLLESIAGNLVSDAPSLPPLSVNWGSKVYTKSDFDALCTVPPDIDASAFALRLRAVGEGPFHRLRVSLHERTFSLDPVTEGGPFFKGGRSIGNVED